MGDHENAKDYRFFLSYSRRDAKELGEKENVWFATFRRNLIRDVAKEARLPASVDDDEVGFYDRQGIQTGDVWNEALVEALQSSRVLVCLYSPNYFASQYCGKEFQVFSERVAAYEKDQGGRPPGYIIPVLWDAPTKLPSPLPAPARDLQFSDADLGPLYAEKGLMYLLRMGEDKAYQAFLMSIAEKIAGAGRTLLPRARLTTPLDKIESAFHPAATRPPAGELPAVKGVKAAWLVYVAGSEADYASIRQTRRCYGTAGFEWQPYLPDTDNIVGAVATNVASGKGLFPQLLPVTEKLVADLQAAEDSNTMAVLVVDPWSISIRTFESAMKDLDRARLTNCGVIVLWNDKDEETHQDAARLEARLKQTLSRIWTSRDVYFQHSVPSEEEFRKALGTAIDEVRRRISDRGRLLRGESPSEEEAFPKLPTGGVAAATAGGTS